MELKKLRHKVRMIKKYFILFSPFVLLHGEWNCVFLKKLEKKIIFTDRKKIERAKLSIRVFIYHVCCFLFMVVCYHKNKKQAKREKVFKDDWFWQDNTSTAHLWKMAVNTFPPPSPSPPPPPPPQPQSSPNQYNPSSLTHISLEYFAPGGCSVVTVCFLRPLLGEPKSIFQIFISCSIY